ncbi:MAG: hypothetical protein R3C44_03215 [Chloroflexota bacterium]
MTIPFGALVQYPATNGSIFDYESFCAKAHEAGSLVVVATDLFPALALLRARRAGADVAIGSSQRFGVPMGYGGPHAGFLATMDTYKRIMPGRLIGALLTPRGTWPIVWLCRRQ